ncbi:DUF342 domain-containing protein [Agarivorans sp. B2Z047]|uniref:DUF342 domain-containing protein n=1 Tax=Agarivorans sp. B2Z047 TaxID=2652721 RepID=UPI00128E8AC2|nr:FapA family protein [Agarivorans sp. B2Z047]MPW29708.1 DUF342 domain-containing protein [Agarivorans sp. B2Z047]UQN43275.1 FapA family protein [Agarivorans sp. B2Z047]
MLELSCLRLSQDKLAALIEITPQESHVSVSDVKALILRSNFGDYLVDEEAIDDAVAKFAELRESPDLIEQWGQTFVKLANIRNAEVTIDVSEDKMVARATITAAYGGNPISQGDLVSAMQEAGVVFGLQKKRALALLAAAKQADPGVKIKKVVALGRQSVDGEDSRFERFVATPKERLLKPKETEDGRVDMRDLGNLETVEPDVELMRRHPHTHGQAGKNVCGEELPFKQGHEVPFTVGEGTKIAVNDANLILADRTGLPLEIENGMKVDDVLSIKSVDVSYGHVDFAGSVLITGNVGDGMKVKASGDVHINGFVESASITAGGDVVVGKGVIGHRLMEGDENYSCTINAKGELHATFVQYSHIDAGKDVTITSQLLHSKIETDGKVTVSDASGLRGTLVGGSIDAGGEISAVVLGATAGTATQLTISGDFDDIQEERRSLNNIKHTLHDKLSKVLDAQMKLGSTKQEDREEGMADKLSATLHHTRQELVQIDFALDYNQQMEDQFFSNARLTVKKELHPNVRLDIVGHKLFTNREYGPTETKYEDGKMTFTPLTPGKK